MGSSDIDKSSKEAKTPNSQEHTSSTTTGTVNPDWSGFQGYPQMPPHGFMASSPQAHPYMWGVQHPMLPYGTPPHPYVAMYPHGGIYAHPSIPPESYPFSPFAMPSPNGIAEAAVNTSGNAEVDGKASEGKEKLPIKRPKGSLDSLNMITGKHNEPGKTSGASANGVYSKSAESGSEGSSEGSDANSQNESPMKSAGRQDSGLVHPMLPYGTPPHPYVAMYPHGGIYAHPSIPPESYPFSPFAMPSPNGIAEAAVNTSGNAEVDGKASEGKEKLPIKRPKGSLDSLNMITGKHNEPGKTSGASANGVYSKSAESGSEGSSEGSDANSQNESPMKSAGRQDSAEASQNGNSAHSSQNGGTSAPHSLINQTMAIMPISAAGTGGVPGPTTNLNIGMDYWNAAASPSIPAIHGKIPSASVAGGMVTAGSRDMVQSQMWIQDERELKRQRRKQSNRESARRSRLRKQAECDELAQRAEVLKEENASLRAELSRLRSEHGQLAAQNASLKERLGEVPGRDDPRPSRNDIPLNKDTQHSSQTEPTQGGQ